MRSENRTGRHLEHPVLLYGSLEDFLEVTVPFLSAGFEEQEIVFVAARGDYLSPLRAELGPDAARARFVDAFEWHAHPASRLRAFHELVSEEMEGGALGLRLVGEPVWQGAPEFVLEWQRYESALNRVLEPFPVRLMCSYDMSALGDSVLEGALRTHPVVYRSGYVVPSSEFEEPERLLVRWTPPLDSRPEGAIAMPTTDLSSARRRVYAEALRAGVEPERASDLCVAVNEVLTNAQVHAFGATALWAWMDDGRFVCDVEDRGHGIADPLAGYQPLAAESSGRGLWLARQLVDLLQIASRGTGTTVRLHAARA
jgi:anti-sigma regulatory factor (Ser/Thr protein kinase)